MNEDKIRKILAKYAKRRDDNELLLEHRKNEVYNRIPEIKSIDDEISKIGLSLAKIVLLNPKSKDEIVKKTKENIESLKVKKEFLHSWMYTLSLAKTKKTKIQSSPAEKIFLMPKIPTLWEAQAGRSFEARNLRPAWQTW